MVTLSLSYFFNFKNKQVKISNKTVNVIQASTTTYYGLLTPNYQLIHSQHHPRTCTLHRCRISKHIQSPEFNSNGQYQCIVVIKHSGRFVDIHNQLLLRHGCLCGIPRCGNGFKSLVEFGVCRFITRFLFIQLKVGGNAQCCSDSEKRVVRSRSTTKRKIQPKFLLNGLIFRSSVSTIALSHGLAGL